MKTFLIDEVRELAEEVSGKLEVPVSIGPRQMYGNESNYALFIDGAQVSFGKLQSGSSDALGGFLTALIWLDPEVVADVFFRQEEDAGISVFDSEDEIELRHAINEAPRLKEV